MKGRKETVQKCSQVLKRAVLQVTKYHSYSHLHSQHLQINMQNYSGISAVHSRSVLYTSSISMKDIQIRYQYSLERATESLTLQENP